MELRCQWWWFSPPLEPNNDLSRLVPSYLQNYCVIVVIVYSDPSFAIQQQQQQIFTDRLHVTSYQCFLFVLAKWKNHPKKSRPSAVILATFDWSLFKIAYEKLFHVSTTIFLWILKNFWENPKISRKYFRDRRKYFRWNENFWKENIWSEKTLPRIVFRSDFGAQRLVAFRFARTGSVTIFLLEIVWILHLR